MAKRTRVLPPSEERRRFPRYQIDLEEESRRDRPSAGH
jgi:hypothetical protein